MIPIGEIVKVKEAREHHARLRDMVNEARYSFEQSIASLLDELERAKQEEASQEGLLRQAILAEFVLTGNKQPAPGCGVRVLQKLSYDEARAFEWAKEHELALKLDSRAFEKIAKVQSLEFVTITDEPQATITTDLGKALAEK